MRIVLVGSASGTEDEGMRKVLKRYAASLAKVAEVRTVSPGELLVQIPRLRRWAPSVVHYMAGPTTRGLAALRVAMAVLPGAAGVVSLIHPALGRAGTRLVRNGRFDLVLGSTSALGRLEPFRARAVPFLESGVDTGRFVPPPAGVDRSALRARLGLPVGRPLLLHVGHLKRGRNLQPLGRLAGMGFQVAVVGSSRTGEESGVRQGLADAGCHVRSDFLPEIEAWYQAADCYVFPTVDPGHAIQLPLSILEAMAAGMPVVSSDFGSVREAVGDAPGLRIVDRVEPDSLAAAVGEVQGRGSGNRGHVMPFDWEARTIRLMELYRSVAQP